MKYKISLDGKVFVKNMPFDKSQLNNWFSYLRYPFKKKLFNILQIHIKKEYYYSMSFDSGNFDVYTFRKPLKLIEPRETRF